MKNIIVGYSGGIDSTAVLIDFVHKGYTVYAVFLQLNNNERAPVLPQKLRDMGIRLICIDSRDMFSKNIKTYFAQSYADGLTPNPCAMCNRYIKFSILSKYASDNGYDGFSTGHYICISNGEIRRGNDSQKDQSYFVSTVKQEDIFNYINSRNCTATKQENRELLANTSIHSEREESQDICFVQGDYGDYLKNEMGLEARGGIFVDMDGRTIGRYNSHYRYTIGMREGLNGGSDRRLYVRKIDAMNGKIVLADEDHMQFIGFSARVISRFTSLEGELTVKTRYRQKEMPVRTISLKDNTVHCSLSQHCRDITPGQIAVFYRNETVVMSTEIVEAF